MFKGGKIDAPNLILRKSLKIIKNGLWANVEANDNLRDTNIVVLTCVVQTWIFHAYHCGVGRWI